MSKTKAFIVPKPHSRGQALDLIAAGVLYFKQHDKVLFYFVVVTMLGALGLNSSFLRDYFTSSRATIEEIGEGPRETEFSLIPEALADARNKDGLMGQFPDTIHVRGEIYPIDPEFRAFILSGKPAVLIQSNISGRALIVSVEDERMKSLHELSKMKK